VSIEDDGSRFIVTLPGVPTQPFARLVAVGLVPGQPERWFEVYYGDIRNNIDVITRQPDEVTLAIARGFAAFCKRFWQGEFEPGEENLE
jgi:hypothetical protein